MADHMAEERAYLLQEITQLRKALQLKEGIIEYLNKKTLKDQIALETIERLSSIVDCEQVCELGYHVHKDDQSNVYSWEDTETREEFDTWQEALLGKINHVSKYLR